MLKVRALWISRNLSAHDVHQRVASSRDPLGLYTQVTKNWFHGLFTGDKIQIHQ